MPNYTIKTPNLSIDDFFIIEPLREGLKEDQHAQKLLDPVIIEDYSRNIIDSLVSRLKTVKSHISLVMTESHIVHQNGNKTIAKNSVNFYTWLNSPANIEDQNALQSFSDGLRNVALNVAKNYKTAFDNIQNDSKQMEKILIDYPAIKSFVEKELPKIEKVAENYKDVCKEYNKLKLDAKPFYLDKPQTSTALKAYSSIIAKKEKAVKEGRKLDISQFSEDELQAEKAVTASKEDGLDLVDKRQRHIKDNAVEVKKGEIINIEEKSSLPKVEIQKTPIIEVNRQSSTSKSWSSYLPTCLTNPSKGSWVDLAKKTATSFYNGLVR